MNPTSGPYSPSWRRFELWYAASFILLLGYFPVLRTIFAFRPDLKNGPTPLFFFFIYGSIWVWSTNVVRRWPCPRCGDKFFGSYIVNRWPLLFVKTCRSCGLPKYAASDPDLQPSARSS